MLWCCFLLLVFGGSLTFCFTDTLATVGVLLLKLVVTEICSSLRISVSVRMSKHTPRWCKRSCPKSISSPIDATYTLSLKHWLPNFIFNGWMIKPFITVSLSAICKPTSLTFAGALLNFSYIFDDRIVISAPESILALTSMLPTLNCTKEEPACTWWIYTLSSLF